MTITAKYAGKCTRCGVGISVGDKIDWEKGKGAAHISCPERRESKVSKYATCLPCEKGWNCAAHNGETKSVPKKAVSKPRNGCMYCGKPVMVNGVCDYHYNTI